MTEEMINIIREVDYTDLLSQVKNADLILTDPPYGLDEKLARFSAGGIPTFHRVSRNKLERRDWDAQDIDLNLLADLCYRALRKGGTAIIWYDLWKITPLAQALTDAGFKQLRVIEWLKTNPVPVNTRTNYMSNAREIAISAVKVGKPTFNSHYDKGIYHYPIPGGERLHPTQKPLDLFIKLIEKHSEPADFVVDPFLGSGTTAVACATVGRNFVGGDINPEYIEIARKRFEQGVPQWLRA